MATITTNHGAVGVGTGLRVRPGETLTYTISNTFVGSWQIERSNNNFASAETLATGSGTAGPITLRNDSNEAWTYRSRCTAYTSGTITAVLADVTDTLKVWDNADGTEVFKITEAGVETPSAVIGAATVSGTAVFTGNVAELTRTTRSIFIPAAVFAKAGATAGWVPAGATNLASATLPAAQTASTLVLPIPGLFVGDIVTGFHLVGQIESAGNTVTLDASLRKLTAAAADLTDASIGAMTQISATSDTAVTAANSTHTLATPETIAADESLYLLITGTTAASTDVALQGAVIILTQK